MTEPDQYPPGCRQATSEFIEELVGEPPESWFCYCKDSDIRWVDAKRPHVAVNGPGWFCMGCLTEFVRMPRVSK